MAGFLSCLNGRLCNKAERGSVSVEMSLLLPVFMLLMMGSVEMCLMWGAQALMENAAYNTSRLAKTGFITSGQTQAQTVSQLMTNELQSFGTLIDVTKLITTETAYSSFANAGSGSGGTSGYGTEQQIVVYTITYPWKIVTPINGIMQSMGMGSLGNNGIINLNSNIVVRNEPYG